MDPNHLRKKTISIRRELLTMIFHGKAGHTGGALSSVDILTALYYAAMRIDPSNPQWKDRDYFIMSKGHSVEGLFCILADLGFFPGEELKTFNAFGTRLIGHPNNSLPGIEMNTGALGHGLSIATGIAKGLKMSGRANRVFTVMGDGELAEGSVWEAAMSAAFYKLDNLTAVIDRNRLQISGDTENVKALEPLADKWNAFGWQVAEVDGHDVDNLAKLFAGKGDGKPRMFIARTCKGKGVREMENIAKWHHGVPNEETFESAMRQLAEAERALA